MATTTTKTAVVAQNANSGLKHLIIGKTWLNSKDGTKAGSIRINRDLPRDITLTPGTVLYLHANTKRPDKLDADFSVSVLLPAQLADQLIGAQRQLFATRQKQDEGEITVD
jgi:hypothetical protein